MMQKEKILQKSILIAAAAVSLAAAPTIVKAAGENDGAGGADATAPTGTFSDAGLQSVSVNASNEVLTVTPLNNAREILVGTGKVKIKKARLPVRLQYPTGMFMNRRPAEERSK